MPPWDKYATPAQPQMPADPTFSMKGPQAAATLGQTGASTANTQATTARTRQQIDQDNALFDAQKKKAEAEALVAQMQAQAAQAEAQSKNPLNPQALQGASADAMSKLQTIDRIRRNIANAILPAVGFGAQTAAGLGGTKAHDVKADIESLKAGGALTEVLKMSQATGKNPFSPMSNSDVDLISRNTANLDQGQTPTNFNDNLKNYQSAYTKAYAGSEGLKTLNNEIARLLPTIPPEKREAFKADALRRYNERMGQTPTAQSTPRQSSGVIDFNDWNH